MGILNLTPDSFSDGGRLFSNNRTRLDEVLKTASQMQADGADILDLGGESTRPGAQPVSSQEELDRVLPALECIRRELDVAISIDTSNPELMTQAAEMGADMLNDVRSLGRTGALEAAVNSGLPVCLMHMQGDPGTMQANPQYEDVTGEVGSYLSQQLRRCEQAGIARERIILDPGFGFGKSLAHNLQLLHELPKLVELGQPLLVGLSRKRMVAELTGRQAPEDRLAGSLALAQVALDKGARIIRCHDVAPTCDMMRTWNAIRHNDIP